MTKIVGNFDRVEYGQVQGWIAESDHIGVPRVATLVVDDQPTTSILAELPRADLTAAGLDSNEHGFSIPIPLDFYDARRHKLEVRDQETNETLGGGPIEFFGKPLVAKSLRVDGAHLYVALVGGAQGKAPAGEYYLFESGRMKAKCLRSSEADTNDLHFLLPNELLDGNIHVFEIRSSTETSNFSLSLEPVFLSDFLTPHEVLLKFSQSRNRPSLSPLSGAYYDNLSAVLQSWSNRDDAISPDEIIDVQNAHQVLLGNVLELTVDRHLFEFPQVVEPEISVVIPVHNEIQATFRCLASLRLSAERSSFEVIVVDDGSSDRTLDLSSRVRGINLVRNDKAEGFVKACNRGAREAAGRYIVLLNNDTEVTSGWLDEMRHCFDRYDDIGMVGAKLIFPDGRLQEAGGIVWSSANPWNYGRGGNQADPRFNYTRQVDYLSGACLMLPIELWQELGGLDEHYCPAYFEDTDLGFRVREKGYKTVYTPLAKVVHYEGLSNGRDEDASTGLKRFQKINRPKFRKRWHSACSNNGLEGVSPDLVKDRNISQRALVIDAETPFFDQNAGAVAALNEMRLLQSLGVKCTFVPHNMAWMGPYSETLQRMGIEFVFAPFYQSVSEVIEKRGQEFDFIYITRFYVAEGLIDRIRSAAPQARIILNNADLHFLREMRAAVLAEDEQQQAAARETRDRELAVMRKVDLVLCYSNVEKSIVESHNFADSTVALCPWVAEPPVGARPVSPWGDRQGLAFLGNFDHPPNKEGLKWFLKEIYPKLRESLPTLRFVVYGSHLDDELRKTLADQDGVEVGGWVKDISQVFQDCRVFVAPLLSGAGIKGKVIDALVHGTPCVTTTIGAEGITTDESGALAVVDDVELWVERILHLHGDEATWTAMSARAQEFSERQFGFERGVQMMQSALELADVIVEPSSSALVSRLPH